MRTDAASRLMHDIHTSIVSDGETMSFLRLYAICRMVDRGESPIILDADDTSRLAMHLVRSVIIPSIGSMTDNSSIGDLTALIRQFPDIQPELQSAETVESFTQRLLSYISVMPLPENIGAILSISKGKIAHMAKTALIDNIDIPAEYKDIKLSPGKTRDLVVSTVEDMYFAYQMGKGRLYNTFRKLYFAVHMFSYGKSVEMDEHGFNEVVTPWGDMSSHEFNGVREGICRLLRDPLFVDVLGYCEANGVDTTDYLGGVVSPYLLSIRDVDADKASDYLDFAYKGISDYIGVLIDDHIIDSIEGMAKAYSGEGESDGEGGIFIEY